MYRAPVGWLRVPMNVAAEGPSGFQSGAAAAKVEAIVREQGVVTQDQHWTRAVVIAMVP